LMQAVREQLLFVMYNSMQKQEVMQQGTLLSFSRLCESQ